jgi:tocopherol cyclase
VFTFLKKKLNPCWYQGIKNNTQHFEGWYFKVIDKPQHNLLAIIPGVFIVKKGRNSHSFIQIFNGADNKTYFFKFPLEDFSSKKNDFDIQINSNQFSSQRVVLDLKDSSLEIKGNLHFTKLTHWPKTFISPGIMGWYSWVPFMECYHGIVSLDHRIRGSLLINNQKVSFTDGKGYTEKDWGKSFPKAWLWCQSNHFRKKNVCFTGSIAIIPWIRKPFLGYIFGLCLNKKLYRFTTYLGAKLINFDIEDSKVKWMIQQKHYVLKVIAHRSDGGFLQAPKIGGKMIKISETLNSSLEIKLSFLSNVGEQVILEDTGRFAGFEIGGEIARLKKMYNTIV